MDKTLGKINKVDLREIFANEAQDFTPWLEKNTALLSKVIGIEIIDVSREGDVGNFNCDLIGSEANSEDKVIIENQIEQTNHDHLGKLITYASGIGAKYVVWVAKKIREEHQKALEWLNENTQNGISFFGVEVEAVRIDDSRPALDFNLVVQPNTWSREFKQSAERADESHQKYLQFFTRLVSEYERIKPEWGHLTPRTTSWLAFGAGRTGFKYAWAFRGNNRFGMELFIDTKDKEEVKNYFHALFQLKSEIDKKISSLSWEELPDSRASRIALYYNLPVKAKQLSEQQMDDLVKWAIEKMDLFKKIFTEYIKMITNN